MLIYMSSIKNIELTLQCSKLNKIKCVETIDVKKLKLLINSTLLKETINNPFSNKIYDNEKQQLIKYLSLFKNNKCEISYVQTKSINCGRVFPKNGLGLFNLRKEIRHTIAKDYYVDIDIENCHPVILEQICKHNNIECKSLSKYINKREDILKETIENYKVSRGDAKTLYIQLLYFGTFESWAEKNNIPLDVKPSKFITKLKSELNLIGEVIVSKNNKLSKLIEKKKDEQKIKDYNLKATVCSYFLQQYENLMLETIYSYCVSKNYITNNNCVLCADGIMIPKISYKPELLIEFQSIIKQELDFDVIFTKKEMDLSYSTEDLENNQSKDDDDNDEYAKMKEVFELTNFKILDPITYATLNEHNKLIIRDKTDFKNVYENLIVKDKFDNKINFVDQWLKDECCRTYDRLDFLPMQTAPKNVYNLFNGYKAEAIKQSDESLKLEDSLIIKHIKDIICNGDINVYNYFMSFMANMIQHPYKKSNVSLILKSLQGCGKDTILEYFGNHILGAEYYLNEDSIDLIFGRFNDAIDKKILIVINEASGKDTFQMVDKLKNRITKPINMIESKGKKPFAQTNNISYVFLTNNDNPVKISYDDRRYCGIECNNEKANNTEYFNELYKEINSCKYDKLIYDYLKSIDLTNYNFYKERPVTKFYENMKEFNIPIIIKFFEDLIENMQHTTKYSATELFKLFNEFLVRNHYKYDCNITSFGCELNKYSDHGIIKKRSNTGINIIFDYYLLKKYINEKFKLSEVVIDSDEIIVDIVKDEFLKLSDDDKYDMVKNLENKLERYKQKLMNCGEWDDFI